MDKYFILAGEPSGDEHGAKLIKSLNKISKSKFIGIGGKKMYSAGLSSLYPIEKMSVMGFAEIIKHLMFFKKVEKTVIKKIVSEKPDAIILIDYPGFNLRIAKKIKTIISIPIIYYISPQLWAWKESRIKSLNQYTDRILTIFPFEKAWFAKRHIKVDWVGHPFLDNFNMIDKFDSYDILNINHKAVCISLFPGSRQQEVYKHLDLFIESAKLIVNKIPNYKVIINVNTDITINRELPKNFIITNNRQKEVLCASDVTIMASGTVTVEAAIYGAPMVVVYKMNYISWLITKLLITTKYVAMPNIILDKEIVKELIQGDATKKRIAKEALLIINNNEVKLECKKNLKIIKKMLTNGNASDNVASIIKGI